MKSHVRQDIQFNTKADAEETVTYVRTETLHIFIKGQDQIIISTRDVDIAPSHNLFRISAHQRNEAKKSASTSLVSVNAMLNPLSMQKRLFAAV